MTITADSVQYDNPKKITTATGNAIVEDVSKSSKKTLKAQNIIAHHAKNTDDAISFGGGDIQKLDLSGNISLKMNGRNIHADRCTYIANRDHLTCSGNIHLYTENKNLYGEFLNADLKMGVYTLKKSPKKQIHATFEMHD